VRKALACIVENGCYANDDYFKIGCIIDKCSGETKAVFSEIAKAAKEVAALTGVPSATASSSATFVTVSMTTVLLLAVMSLLTL